MISVSGPKINRSTKKASVVRACVALAPFCLIGCGSWTGYGLVRWISKEGFGIRGRLKEGKGL